MPSLHAAFPWLVFLFSIKIWGRKGLSVLADPVFIWWASVYSGHHYFVDAIAGVIYATAAYYALSGQPYGLAVRAFRWLRGGEQRSVADDKIEDEVAND